MHELLFLYGTLRPDRAPREIAHAASHLIAAGPATVRARLYDLGEYPAVILDDTAGLVRGELFAVPDAATLAALDAYEDFRPHDPAASLFLRSRTVATLDDGTTRDCWIYVWNEARNGAPAYTGRISKPDEDSWDMRRGDCCGGE